MGVNGEQPYREWSPPAGLAGAVTCLWRRTVPEGGAEDALILPDGCVDLIWESGRGAFLAGPDTGPMPSTLVPGRTLVGVRFRPGAGGQVLGVPLDSLLNLRVDAVDWRPGPARQLPGDLPPGEALRRLVRLTERLTEQRPPQAAVIRAAQRLRDPAARVTELGPMLGLGERQLRRRFTAAVGYGPKTLQRVLRFQYAIRRLSTCGRAPVDLATLALEAGYADQAHLTRETRELAGMPPTALARLLGDDEAVDGDASEAVDGDASEVRSACGG